MSNEVTVFDPNNVQVPAHIQKAIAEHGGNITSGQTVNSLSPGGKIWSVTLDGNKTVLTYEQDGDKIPVPHFKGVVLDYNPRRGRAYYEGTPH